MPTEVIDPAARIVEVRATLMQRAGRMHELLEVDKATHDDKWMDEIRSGRFEIEALDAEYDALLRQIPAPEVRGQGPVAANSAPGHEQRTLGQQVTDDEGYRSFVKSGRPSGNVEVRTLITGPGDLGAGTYGTEGGAFIPIMPYAVFPQAVRRDRLVMRDILPVTQTSYPVIHYISETYISGAGLANTVAEGGLKPEVTMQWSAQQAVAQKIAAWVPATLESITDAPGLRSAIDNRLVYMLARREEDSLLNGNGSSPNLLGLLNAPNIQTQGYTTNDLTTVGLAEALIESHDGSASAIIMNPTNYWTAMTASSTTLTGASPFAGPPGTIWGMPVVRTPRMTLNTALIGDFNQGAELFQREDTTVRVGDQHSDYFVRNQVVILVEERLALAIYRGDLFCTLTGLS